jgi:hypothetical protein
VSDLGVPFQPIRWVKSFVRKLLSRHGYSVVRAELVAAEQAELQQLRRAAQGAVAPAPSVGMLELLSQPVPSPTRPTDGLYTPIFSYDGLINDPKVIHNHDFMRNPRYVKAYEVAEQALGYDHKMFWRLHVALWCATQAQKLPGDFVECGVWRGFLATAIMNYIPWPANGKQFYLFDTWEGLDERYLTEGERNNQAKLDHFKPYYANQYEFVEAHFSNYPNVHLVKGSVPETLGSVEIAQVSYLSLDMNCTPPELAAAEYFWDRIVPGGMILLDDYGFVSYEDQKLGFDDFAAKHGVEILALPTGQGLMIKPGDSAVQSRPICAASAGMADVEAAMRSVTQILVQEGIQSHTSEMSSNIGNLVGLYQGYRQAYLAHCEELGYLRQTAAPIVRKQTATAVPERSSEFLGRIGLLFDQPVVEEQHQRPSVFLVTLPKSATVFIAHSLVKTLGYDFTSTLVTPTFPKNIIWGTMLLDFLKGGMVSASHLQPDGTNLTLLARCGVNKCVLHIRDPRAALLSWAHFVMKSMRKERKPFHPPVNSLDALDNLEHFVDASFPDFVNWIDGWVSALAANPALDVLILTHDELSQSPETYFGKIFTFYALGTPELQLVDKAESTHFRSGDNSEWRRVFPDNLIQKMNDQIPERLWEKFGWVR